MCRSAKARVRSARNKDEFTEGTAVGFRRSHQHTLWQWPLSSSKPRCGLGMLVKAVLACKAWHASQQLLDGCGVVLVGSFGS